MASTHTRGDTGIFVEGDGVLFAGDIVMNRAFLAFNRSSSGHAWLDVLDHFEGLNPTTIVPAHGAIGDGGLIGQQRAIVQGITERVRQLKAAGRSMSDAVELLTDEFRTAYPGWTSPNRVGAAVRAIWAEMP